MAHLLQLSPGKKYLPCAEVVRRLRAVFDVVIADQEAGRDFVDDMIAKLIELKAPQPMIDGVAAQRESSVRIFIPGERPENCHLSFVLQPDEPLIITYHSLSHEKQSRPLLEQSAKVLGYEIHIQ